eukprot:gene7984-5745_t
MASGMSLFGERKGFVYEGSYVSQDGTENEVIVAVRGIDVAVVGERDEVNRLYVEHVWPSSIVVSDYLCQHPEIIRDKVVIELGAGAALPSLVAEKLGAKLALVSDYPEDDVLRNIDDAIRINKCTRAISVGYKWGDSIDEITKRRAEWLSTSDDDGCVDVVLLADVLWRDTYAQHDALLKSIAQIFEGRRGVVFIGIAHRPCEGHTPDNDLEFLQRAVRDYRFTYLHLLSTSQYSDAMDSDPIEVHLYRIDC